MRKLARRGSRRPGLARVLPFPGYARRAYVAAIAENVINTAPKYAEDYLFDRMCLYRWTLIRKRVDPTLIDEDCKRLEAAIRAAIWRLTFSHGDAG